MSVRAPSPRVLTTPLLPPCERVAVSADGRVLAGVDASGVLHLADLEAGRPTWSVDVGASLVLALTPSTVAVATQDGVRLVLALAGQVTGTLASGDAITAVGFASEGTTLVAAAGAEVSLWRVATRRLVARHAAPAAVTALAPALGGHVLLACADGRVGRLDPKRGLDGWRDVGAPLAGLARGSGRAERWFGWSQDDAFDLAGEDYEREAYGGPVLARSVEGRTCWASGQGTEAGGPALPRAMAAAWHPDGVTVALATQAGVELVNADTGEVLGLSAT